MNCCASMAICAVAKGLAAAPERAITSKNRADCSANAESLAIAAN